LQASHWPVQSLLQHTPSTHEADWHWPSEAQVPPSGALAEHTPPAPQKPPSAQSVSRVHVARQPVPPHV
jgi:hypothetical protein